jgi:hypothetical protein
MFNINGMRKIRNGYSILVGKSGGRRITTYVTGHYRGREIRLVQDGVQWRAFVNTVMNLWAQ